MVGAKEGRTTKYQLRGYQQDAVEATLTELPNYTSCAMVLPTGSGKSLIIIELIDRLRSELGIDGSILILCHLTDPLYQLFDSYKELGERPARQAFWKRNIPHLTTDVVYSTMQKMARQDSIDAWRHHMQQTMVRKPKYIIIDEAHSYGAPSYRKMRDLFPDAKLIGLSATPFRSNKYSFSCFEKVTYTRSMGDLIALGFLTTPKTEQVSIPEDMDNHGGRIALSYRIWKERESKRGLVTVVYLPTVDLAKSALASFTQQKGVRCGYLDGSSTLRETRKVLGAAREGKYDVLINCKKLETGVDIPNIGSVIMPYPVDSVVAYMQRVGRALRLFPGKEFAMIYLCGSAPSIAKGDWIDVHNRAMETREPKPSESLKEELSEGGPDKPRLEWTKEAIKACEILEQKDMVNLSKFLAFKRFPKKYDVFIGRILKRGVPTEGYDNSPASQIQREILVNRFKFTESRARSLTKREASTFINGFKSYMDTDPFIFRDGPHMGKHPSELHPLTRKHCHGDTKKRLQAWWKAGRPMRREE